MFQKQHQCIDVGMPHCPCSLAAFDQCITCSRLAGENRCDCEWQGVCVYNEYLQNGNRINQQRRGRMCKILQKKWYSEDLAVLKIQVPRGFAQLASMPGSCVFVKASKMESTFDMPLSVMGVDWQAGVIELAIQVTGIKSEALLEEKDVVELRGVYHNGLTNVEKIMTRKPQKVLCITKGIGLAPAVNYCRWADGKDSIDFLVDLEKINRTFADDVLQDCIIDSIGYCKLPLSVINCNGYDAILLCASDYYQEHMQIPFDRCVLSNNVTMCCGEGICGACTSTDANGICRKRCKCKK